MIRSALLFLALLLPVTASLAVPHADDPFKQAEHLAIEGLVKYADVTITAVATGNWGDPTTWDQARVPGAGDRVLIPYGTTVSVDGVFAASVYTIRVDGWLTFLTDRNTSLQFVTMVVAVNDSDATQFGRLSLGTADDPVHLDVTCRLVIGGRGIRDDAQRAYDPMDFSGGVICHGKFEAYGAPNTPYLRPGINLAAGTTTINIPTPAGWRVGDELGFCSNFTDPAERRTLMGVNPLRLNSPLLVNHYNEPIAKLNRNVSIQSAVPGDRTQRGHFMQMHSQRANLRDVAFIDMGRTDAMVQHTVPRLDSNGVLVPGTDANTIGRYGALHAHIRSGALWTQTPITVNSCVAWGKNGKMPKHGFVHHGAYAFFEDCVAWNGQGSGFFGENGSEIGAWRRNLATLFFGTCEAGGVDTRPPSPPFDPAQRPDDHGHNGFAGWSQSALIEVVDSLSFNNFSGWTMFARETFNDQKPNLPSRALWANLNLPTNIGLRRPPIDLTKFAPDADGSVRVQDPPTFLDGCYHNGSRQGIFGYILTGQDVGSSLSFKAIYATKGWENPYTVSTTLRNSLLRGTYVPGATVWNAGFGIYGNEVTSNISLVTDTIEGWAVGWPVPVSPGRYIIDGCTFQNQIDLAVPPPWAGTVTITNTKFLPPPTGSALKKTAAIQLDNYPSRRLINSNLSMDSFFKPFHLTIDGAEILHNCRMPTYVPFPQAVTGVPAGYIGLTNQQLFDQFGVWIGGYQVPAQTLTPHPAVSGGGIGTLGPKIGPQ